MKNQPVILNDFSSLSDTVLLRHPADGLVVWLA
jgi:hypothetical protein